MRSTMIVDKTSRVDTIYIYGKLADALNSDDIAQNISDLCGELARNFHVDTDVKISQALAGICEVPDTSADYLRDNIVVREIASWALDNHFDKVGNYLDLSDFELTKILTWLNMEQSND